MSSVPTQDATRVTLTGRIDIGSTYLSRSTLELYITSTLDDYVHLQKNSRLAHYHGIEILDIKYCAAAAING